MIYVLSYILLTFVSMWYFSKTNGHGTELEYDAALALIILLGPLGMLCEIIGMLCEIIGKYSRWLMAPWKFVYDLGKRQHGH